MLRLTGSGVHLNGAMGAAAVAPAVRLLPWQRTGRIDVETLVAWAFDDQRVGAAAAGLNEIEALAAGLTWQGRSGCGCARAADIAKLDTRVDVSRASLNSNVHPVAEAVMNVIECSPQRDLLMAWARTGAKPGGWAIPPRWVEPVNGWVDGERFAKAAPIYDLVGGAAGGQRRALPIVARDPDVVMREVGERRAIYALWWQAVADLGFELSLMNLGFVVLPPGSPREPWAQAVKPLVPLQAAVPSMGMVLWVARWDALSMQMVAALGGMGRHEVTVIDVDEAAAQAAAYEVRAVPTAMVMQDGKPVVVTVGVQNAKALARWIERAKAMRA
ncbi:MAG: hypothetical protein KGQ52_13280 [Alphaproteobacteria bacterium]|nr:hypothetical protein [Alphaproteobacteria bacterium]